MKLTRPVIATVLLVAAFPAFAQTPYTDPSAKTFMWKADHGGTSLYLLGSIHALKEDAYPLPPTIDAAFDEVEVVVFEIDLDDMTAAAIQMMTVGSLGEGATLERVVGPELWSKFTNHVTESGLDPSFFKSMKPWMAALTLTAFELSNQGYLSTAGLDSHLSQRAQQAGKERRALETAEYQVSLFADLTPEQSLAFLSYSLTDLETIIPEMDQLYLDWRAGRFEPVEQLLLEGFEEFPDVFKRLVVDRNLAWMPQIEELLGGDRDAMVVVGSMHLVGEAGLVNLLREKGFAVEQQ
jgi:uncharacterized protein YbaP (TraB family)